MSKITLDDTLQSAVTKMALGNPGALAAVMEQVRIYGPGEAFVLLCHLDDMRLYGSNIWLAYKDINQHDPKAFHDSVFDRSVLGELEKLPYFNLERFQ